MALLGSKKEFKKKDINFFAEFTASARQQAQILAVVAMIGVVAIGLSFVIWVYDLFRNSGVKNEIDELQTTLASEEYAGLELKAQNLQQEINDRNLYYYTLTEMRRIVDEYKPAKTELVNLIGDSIPSTAYISDYELTGTNLMIDGLTFSYYDAANIVSMLNESDVFSDVTSLYVTHDNTLSDMAESTQENAIDVYYDFTISGTLTNDIVISVGYYANTDEGTIALDGVTTYAYAAGDTYLLENIGTFDSNGISYTLSSVSIDDVALSSDELATIQANGTISGIATADTEISLYYAVSEETTEGSEA